MADIYDGAWKLVNHDAQTGRTVWVLHEDGKTHFRTDYPVESIIDANKEAASAASGTRWGDWTRIASVPLNIFHGSGLTDALTQDDDRFVKRFLNDGDNRAWRTREGNV